MIYNGIVEERMEEVLTDDGIVFIRSSFVSHFDKIF